MRMLIRVARFISFYSGHFGGPVRHIKELTNHLKPYPYQTYTLNVTPCEKKIKSIKRKFIMTPSGSRKGTMVNQ